MAGLEKFLLICAPSVQADLGYRQILKRGFFRHLQDASAGVRIVHPRFPEVASFPVWLDREDFSAKVAKKSLLGHFNSAGSNRNLLFVRAAFAAKNSLFLQPPHGQQASYYRCGLPSGLQVPESILMSDPEGGLASHLYSECEQRHAGEINGWKLQAADSPLGQEEPSAYFNPLILEVQLEGHAFQTPSSDAAHSDPRRVLQAMGLLGSGADAEHESQILAVFPCLSAERDVKLVAWEHLIRSQALKARPNLVERLILGGAALERGRSEAILPLLAAFFTLDELGGVFSVRSHGSPSSHLRGADPAVTFTWSAPEELRAGDEQANGRWLAAHVVSSWASGVPLAETPRGGAAAGTELFRFQGSWSGPVPQRFERAQALAGVEQDRWERVTLPLSQLRQDDDDDEPGQAGQMPEWTERLWVEHCLPQVDFAAKPFMVSLLNDARLRTDPQVLSLVRRATRDPVVSHANVVVEYNLDRLLGDVGSRFIAPRCPVRIEVPIGAALAHEPNSVLGAEPRYLDLQRSLPDGGVGLLSGLVHPERQFLNSLNRSVVTLKPTAGWWNDWHLSLFSDPAEVRILFEAAGLTLGSAALGEAALGGDHAAAPVPEVMSFTRPVWQEVA